MGLIEKLQRRWQNLGIPHKLMLAFGSIIIFIIITIFISVFLLHYVQKETENRLSNSSRIRNLVLEMSWRLERSRGIEASFFLRYLNSDFSQIPSSYLEPVYEHLAETRALTSELSQLLNESPVWQESNVNLELLFIAQSRHAAAMDQAIALVTRLAEPQKGLVFRFQDNLALLRKNLIPLGDKSLLSLANEINTAGYAYLIEHKRPRMQLSFNVTEQLRDQITISPTLTASQKSVILQLIKDYLSLGEEILHVDILLRNKLNDFELQTDTLDSITKKMTAVADREREHSQEKIDFLYRIILALVGIATVVMLGIIIVVTRIIGKSIVDNIITMSHAVKKFEEGDLEAQIRINSRDELGLLAGSFNRMAARIKTLIDNLELMIADRTKNLISTNEKLRSEISERIRSQEELKKSEALLKTTQQLAKIGGWEWDVEQQTMFWTDEVYRIHEYEENDIKPDSKERFLRGRAALDPEVLKVIQSAYQNCLSDAQPFDLEHPFTTTKGRQLWVRMTAQPVLENGKVVRVIGTIMDMSGHKQAEEQIKASLNEKEVLLQEIHHRVKNNMQVIASLIKLQMNNEKNEHVKEILSESHGRVYAMSAIHETLYQSESLSKINLESYLLKISKALLQTYAVKTSHVTFHIESSEINLSIEKANPLGLVVNELVSNALKHAFPDDRDGKIAIKIHQPDQNQIHMIISDNGVGFPENIDWKKTSSLGMQLVNTLVENQLDGSIVKENISGTTFNINFKIDNFA